jgi:hypothetical protein
MLNWLFPEFISKLHLQNGIILLLKGITGNFGKTLLKHQEKMAFFLLFSSSNLPEP